MSDQARASIERWSRWVGELEVHPLDGFEYEEMLGVRDLAETRLEIAGNDGLWADLDVVDERFRRLTVEIADAPFVARSAGWWWARVPEDEEARRYLLR